MAAWQFDLQVVPRASLEHHGISPDDQLTAEQFNMVDWWSGHALPAEHAQQLASVLPLRAAWAQGWQVYGEEDGNRIDLLTADTNIEQVNVRIDARALDVSFLEHLVRLARDFDVLFVTPERRVIEPGIEAIWVELELSPAAEFVRDPKDFLKRLKRRE